MKSKPLGPSFREEVRAVFCPCVEAGQGSRFPPSSPWSRARGSARPFPGGVWAKGLGDLMRNVRGESRKGPGFSGGVRDPGPLAPASGSPCMMS